MATRRQVEAAKRNVESAQKAVSRKRTIAHLPEAVRHDFGKQGAAGRRRGGEPGWALEDKNREQLYEIARERNIGGRSKVGKWKLMKAIRGSR